MIKPKRSAIINTNQELEQIRMRYIFLYNIMRHKEVEII